MHVTIIEMEVACMEMGTSELIRLVLASGYLWLAHSDWHFLKTMDTHIMPNKIALSV
jgi:hypothetical protein